MRKKNPTNEFDKHDFAKAIYETKDYFSIQDEWHQLSSSTAAQYVQQAVALMEKMQLTSDDDIELYVEINGVTYVPA